MAIDQIWGPFFKPEVQTSGHKLFAQDKISITSGSDTGIHAFVKLAPPFKVQFATADIASRTFTADCSCPNAKKGRLCKHIWATLWAVEQDYPDFLSNKGVIEKPCVAANSQADSRMSYQATANLRASEYRKEQYQKQKMRVKEKKQASSKHEAPVEVSAYPPAVEVALAYFFLNGFPMLPPLNEGAVGEAKRKLSRVFHPDRGGSHDEITELNNNSELVLKFLRASA